MEKINLTNKEIINSFRKLNSTESRLTISANFKDIGLLLDFYNILEENYVAFSDSRQLLGKIKRTYRRSSYKEKNPTIISELVDYKESHTVDETILEFGNDFLKSTYHIFNFRKLLFVNGSNRFNNVYIDYEELIYPMDGYMSGHNETKYSINRIISTQEDLDSLVELFEEIYLLDSNYVKNNKNIFSNSKVINILENI